jgi:hypothetical protein
VHAVHRAYPGVINPTKETARFSSTWVGAKTTRTHVELRLLWPVLGSHQHELFAPRELRVKQCLERVVEYMCHFAWRGAQAVYDRYIIQQRDYGRDDYLVLGDEQVERAVGVRLPHLLP